MATRNLTLISYNYTIIQLYNYTIIQLYNYTIIQLYNFKFFKTEWASQFL